AGLGMAVMTGMCFLLYFFADDIMRLITPVVSIRSLGAEVLRIEAWAEPMFAASIVAYGAFVGVGHTKLPALMNLGSIWIVRVPLAWWMASSMGLRGVWIAMCVELIFRGLIFLGRLLFSNWWK
ncbi:MAG: MATE family efflux transporter, partial [Muribaculaceae bacterium]|nr:MATE family efflux transporter [Muribaculaceae bacterium]